MKLQENYKRLFKGKASSNDAVLIKEGNLAIDDKDGEILNIALQLAAKTMKKFRMSADEKKRLERLLKYFDLKYGDGRPYTASSSPVDATASQLDRR